MDHDQEWELEALEGILSDPSAEPIKLSYGLLKLITCNFSNEIGRGEFGVVYRGDLPCGVVAVERSFGLSVTDKQFMDEIKCLQSANHKNIVRFLGYCADTQEEVMPLDGKLVMAGERNRLLCFEYVPNGNIRQYLEQEKSHGDDWPARYQMIRGICHGLKYIHDKQITHLDLKPENIMLDAHMEAKITDFGLSRFVDQGKSRIITQQIRGTLRYIAPEVIVNGELSLKSDMYALGIIILELLTGTSRISPTDWVESFVLLDCPRAKMLAEIARNCVDAERDSRPTIHELIHCMEELESMINPKSSNANQTCFKNLIQGLSLHEDFTTTPFHVDESSVYQQRSRYPVLQPEIPSPQQFDVYPRELTFVFKPDRKYMSCGLTLTNKSDWPAYCMVKQTNFKCFLPPMSTSHATLDIKAVEEIPLGSVWEIVMLTNEFWAAHHTVAVDKESTFSEDAIQKLVKLTLGYLYRAAQLTCSVIVECKDPLEMHSLGKEEEQETFKIDSMDVHPTEPWVLVIPGDTVSIWNWQTNEKLSEHNSLAGLGRDGEKDDSLAKFIAREQWVVIGKRDGSITVHTCPTMDQVEEFKAHPDAISSLAVHPTRPFLLSFSYPISLKLWNWSCDWSCTTTFSVRSPLWQVKFNPNDTTTFATRGQQGSFQMWRIGRLNPITTTQSRDHRGDSLDFTYTGHRDFAAAIDNDCSISIWDLRKEKFRHTLRTGEHNGEYDYILVLCHPTRPILVTISRCGRIEVWDSITYRLKKTYENLPKDPEHVGFTGARRLVIGYKKRIAVLDIDLEWVPELKMHKESVSVLLHIFHLELALINEVSVFNL